LGGGVCGRVIGSTNSSRRGTEVAPVYLEMLTVLLPLIRVYGNIGYRSDMIHPRGHETWGISMHRRRFVRPALIIILYLVTVTAGCRSIPRPEPIATKERWVCPEFADLPLRLGLYEEAIKEHRRVVLEEPENALAHYHLGYAYGQIGTHALEVEEYRRAVDLGLAREDLFYNLGMACAEVGALDEAEQALRQAATTAPADGENHRALGMVYCHKHLFQEAIASCEQATRSEPENPHAWHCLALALAGAGKMEDSMAAVDQVFRLDAHYSLDPRLLKLLPESRGKNQSP
jgi:tetratricopeptide (TPR) repeat protein